LVLRLLIDTFTALEPQIKELDGEINRRSRPDPVAWRLMTIPGAVRLLPPQSRHFAGGREFPSWTRFRRLARADPTPEIDGR
jgi:transposase